MIFYVTQLTLGLKRDIVERRMLQKIIILVFIIILAAGVYVSRGTFETLGAMLLTVRDLFFSK